MQVMLMRLMSKGEYLIVPKGTKFTGVGKLGLNINPKVKISWVGNMSSAMNMQCSNNIDRIGESNAEQILKSTHAHFMITGGQNSILEISHIVLPQVRQT